MAYHEFPRATDPVPQYVKFPRAIDPVPQERLTLDMLKRALAILTKLREGGAGTKSAPPPQPLDRIGPCASDPLGQKMTRPASVIVEQAPTNPIAFDPSGKDWDGIKAASAHEASEDYTAPPVHVPTHSSAGQERTVPRLHGALTIWTDKTSRPSLWGRGD